jgi:hypothetical protein
MPATWLADVLRDAGLSVNESLVPDWHQRGHTDGPTLDAPVGVLGHHTAGPATGDLPSFRTVRDGRPGLDGPLANLMLSRAGVWVPVAAGRCWHAGAADRPASFPWVPRGDGNGYLIGIEAESCGTVDDWTTAQRESYPRGVAALLRHLGQGPDRFLGHKEWAPSRKPDPAFWDMNAFRASVSGWLITPSGGAGQSAPVTPPPPPAIPPTPAQPAWPLPVGHWLGDVHGPARSHGGDPRYDGAATIAAIKWVQQRLISQGLRPRRPRLALRLG